MSTVILLVVCFWIPVSAALAPVVGKCIKWGGQ